MTHPKGSMTMAQRRRRLAGMVAGAALLAGSLGSWLGTTPAQAMTLLEAVTYAVTTNPAVSEARATRQSIDHELTRARGLYQPQIDLEARFGPEWTVNTNTRTPGAESNQGRWLLRRELSILLQQRIFDGFEADSEVERQAARVDSSAYRVMQRAEAVGLDVVQFYINTLRQIELIRLNRDNVTVHQRIFGDVQNRTGAGETSIADVQQAEERVRVAERNLVEQESRFEEARINYLRVVGQPAGELVMPGAVISALPTDVNTAVDTALQNNPRIRQALADLDVTYAEFRATEAPFYPHLTLESGASYGRNVGGVDEPEASFNVMLVARYNLYRGFIDQAHRQSRVSRIGEAREVLAGQQRDTENEVRRTWNDLVQARRSITLLQQQVTSAEQVRNSYLEQFNIGARTLLDVLDAETELFNARITLVSLQYAELYGQYRLLAVMGNLLHTLNVRPPEETVANARENAGGVRAPHVSALALEDDYF